MKACIPIAGRMRQRAERRAAPSRPGSPRGTVSHPRETRGSIDLPIFHLVEQVQ